MMAKTFLGVLEEMYGNLATQSACKDIEIKELKDENTRLKDENAHLKEENVRLKDENAHLKHRIKFLNKEEDFSFGCVSSK